MDVLDASVALSGFAPTAEAEWIALSDHAGPLASAGFADLVQSGVLVLEMSPPAGDAAILLDYRADEGWSRGFSVFLDAAAGVVVLHRQGASLQRHVLPGPLPMDWHLARLTFGWDGPARRWSLRLEDCAGSWAMQAEGANPMPFAGTDLLALCAGTKNSRRDACLQWFGLGTQPLPTAPSAWVGHRTPIDTARGKIAAADLRAGDHLQTLDGGLQILRGVQHLTLPNRGRFAPLLLRAPYFARQSDLLVAQGQLLLLQGSAVEYLFGEDAVLAQARSLRDGNTALPDARRPLTQVVALDLGAPQVIFADGCPLLAASGTVAAPLPYRLLQDYEAQTLQSMLGRSGARGHS